MATNNIPIPHDSNPTFVPLRPRSAPPIVSHSFPTIPSPLADQCPCTTDRLAQRVGGIERAIVQLQNTITNLHAIQIAQAEDAATQSAALEEEVDAIGLAIDASSQAVVAAQILVLAERLAAHNTVLRGTQHAIETLLDTSDLQHSRHTILCRVVELLTEEVYESYPILLPDSPESMAAVQDDAEPPLPSHEPTP